MTTDTTSALPEHWVPIELLGANASFQRAARTYAEDYARAALAARDAPQPEATLTALREPGVKPAVWTPAPVGEAGMPSEQL